MRVFKPITQRMNVRFHLEGLSLTECRDYIDHQLEVAGSTHPVFTTEAMDAIYAHTRGISREVNNICTAALLEGNTISGSIHISGAENLNSYPKNKNGQTYGSEADATSPETGPELIRAYGENGIEGYVMKQDLYGEQPKTPEEALAIQNSISPGGRDIPLYDVDGQTVIGMFHLGG